MADAKPKTAPAPLALDFGKLAQSARKTEPYKRPGNGRTGEPNPFLNLLTETHMTGEWRALPLPKNLTDEQIKVAASQVEARVRSAAITLGIGANISRPIREADGTWVIKVKGKDKTERKSDGEPAATGDKPAAKLGSK